MPPYDKLFVEPAVTSYPPGTQPIQAQRPVKKVDAPVGSSTYRNQRAKERRRTRQKHSDE
jgi:hypothetical protein